MKNKEQRFGPAVVEDITERQRAEQALTHRIEFEKLVATLSTHFINLAPEEIDDGINQALQKFGEIIGADRSYIFLFSEQTRRENNQHEWCAAAVKPQSDYLRTLSIEKFSWFMERLKRREVLRIPRGADLAPETAAEKEILAWLDIRSFISIPMFSKGNLIGFLGFDSVRTKRTWGEEDLGMLSIAAEIFVNAWERKWSEEALIASERRFRELFYKSPDAIFLEDFTGEVLDVNPAACRLHGVARENIIGKNVLELIPPDKRDQAVRDFAMLVKGELDHVEGFSQTANGEAIPVEIRVSHLDYSGKPALLLHVRDITECKRAETVQRQARDMLEKRVQERTIELECANAALRAEIAERKQTEEALRASETRFRMLVETMNEGMVQNDANFIPTYVNEKLCQMTGYAKEELVGLLPDAFYDEANRRKLQEQKAGRKQGSEQSYEIEIKRKDGSNLPVLVSPKPLFDNEGNFAGSFAVVTDISQHKQEERALRNAEERYRFLYENNPSMYFTVNTEGRILSVNRFGAEQLGYTVAELLEKSVLKISCEEDRTSVQQQLAACLQNPHQVHDWEFRNVRKDGSLLWVKEHARCVQSPDGQTIVLIVCEDITHRKQAEEELRTSRERLRALSANLYSLQEKERTAIARDVHDEFGQVLTSLKMDLTLLERKIKTATAAELPSLFSAIAPMKETINATIDKLTGLITELRPMVFANLLAALEWQAEKFQKRSGLVVEFTAGVDEIPLAQEHATAVFRIIQESLINIARHAKARQVQVEIYEEPPNIFIEIIDDGVGVAPEKLAATEAFGVLGMRERALIFGGEVEIISAPGKGTAVKIRIPQGN